MTAMDRIAIGLTLIAGGIVGIPLVPPDLAGPLITGPMVGIGVALVVRGLRQARSGRGDAR